MGSLKSSIELERSVLGTLDAAVFVPQNVEPLGVRQVRVMLEVERATSCELRKRLAAALAESEALKTAVECLNDQVAGYSAKEKEFLSQLDTLEKENEHIRSARAGDLEEFKVKLNEMKGAIQSQRVEHKECMMRFKLKYAQEQYLAKKLVS